MVTEIVFRRQSMQSTRRRGLEPVSPLAHLAGVILLHGDQALVGAWDAEHGGFIHPDNQQELAAEALAAVLAADPTAQHPRPEIRVFTCPEELVNRFDFGSWQGEWLALTGRSGQAGHGSK